MKNILTNMLMAISFDPGALSVSGFFSSSATEHFTMPTQPPSTKQNIY